MPSSKKSKQQARLLIEVAQSGFIDQGVDVYFPLFLCRPSSVKLAWLPTLLPQVIENSALDPITIQQLLQLEFVHSLRFSSMSSAGIELLIDLGPLPKQLSTLQPHILQKQLDKLNTYRPSRLNPNGTLGYWPVLLRDWFDPSQPDRLICHLRIEHSALALKTLGKLLRSAKREGYCKWQELDFYEHDWAKDELLMSLWNKLYKLR